MPTLGILVNTNQHFNLLLELAKAAHNHNIETYIFFTGQGVLLSQEANFQSLLDFAKISICEVSFRANGLSFDVPGVNYKDFTTQATNADMVIACDRYLIL